MFLKNAMHHIKPTHHGEHASSSHRSGEHLLVRGVLRDSDENSNATTGNHQHGQRLAAYEDECKAFSDGESSNERVTISHGSASDGEMSVQRKRCSFGKSNLSRGGLRVAENTESKIANGNIEIPSSSWAFTARASIVPAKFDHMATLKIVYKERCNGKDGVPLSLLPEILETSRFTVPPPRDLVRLLQSIDVRYKSGDLVRWNLLQNLALQIERKEARYPSVFNSRFSSDDKCNVAKARMSAANGLRAMQRSPSRRTHPEDVHPELSPEVYELMKEIDDHRRKSAEEGNYLAADAAKRRLLELKLSEDNKRRTIMLERHAKEREQAEKAYKEELQERNQSWDERLKSIEIEVEDQMERLKQQHITSIYAFKEKMASKTPVKAQWSKELSKQRQIQAYLSKQGKYLEALEVQQSADRMEQAELQAAITAFQAEVANKEQAIRWKQQTEMGILLQKAARTREEIRKSRSLDLERCHQRHKNVMRELEALQKQEVFRFDQLMQKKVKKSCKGGIFRSKQSVSQAFKAYMKLPDYSTDDACYSGGE